MQTYTTTADPVTGVFKIDLPAALVSGEKIKVTAQKNGQTRSLNLQAPSEPYLPPSSGGGSGGENGSGEEISAGFVIDFPPNKSVFSRIASYPPEYIFSNVLLYTSAALTVNRTNNIYLIKNKIMPVINQTGAYVAFRIPLSDLFSESSSGFAYSQGYYDAATDTASYSTQPSPINLGFFKDADSAFGDFSVDDKYVYLILSNDFSYTPANDSFTSGVYNYCYKVIYGSQEYEVRFKFGHPE